MTRKRLAVMAAGAGAAILAGLLVNEFRSPEAKFGRLLVEDGTLIHDQQDGGRGWWRGVSLRYRRWRVESEYKEFLREHPDHARVRVAYGCFLYDQDRQDEAVQQWQQAIAIDPRLAVAYNNLGEHYAHYGRATDGLRYLQQACELEPGRAVYHYNWALICSLYRNSARELYGWDTREIFRRSLAEFRKARDLAPTDPTYASAYAQTYYFLPDPDWEGARTAWQFCLSQSIDEVQRQRICGYIARICMRLKRYDEARSWIARMTSPEIEPLRVALERKMVALQANP